MRWKELIIVMLVATCIYLMYMKRPIYSTGRLQTIEHVIHGKDSIIVKWKTKIVENKSKVNGLNSQIERLKDSLSVSKQLKDTMTIIEYQDTIISQQDTIIKFYEGLTSRCDTIITEQNKVIELKDSVIFIQKERIKDFKKKKKRRKISSIFASIGLLTLLIVK